MPPATTTRDESRAEQPDLLDPQAIENFRNDPRLPELTALNLKQRQYVWKHCAKPLLSRRRIILTGIAGYAFFLLLTAGINFYVNIGSYLSAGIICLAGYLNNQFWIKYCRRRIRTFIAENGPALQAAQMETWLRLPPEVNRR